MSLQFSLKRNVSHHKVSRLYEEGTSRVSPGDLGALLLGDLPGHLLALLLGDLPGHLAALLLRNLAALLSGDLGGDLES